MTSQDFKPRAKTEGLISRDLADGETVVYDRRTDTAHCLNPSAALVFRYCDGTRSASDLAALLNEEFGLPHDEGLVQVAFSDLARAGLLEGCQTSAAGPVVTRREAIRRFGLGAAAAAALPTVISLMAPKPAAAASCLPNGALCSSGGQCCSGKCVGGICVP